MSFVEIGLGDEFGAIVEGEGSEGTGGEGLRGRRGVDGFGLLNCGCFASVDSSFSALAI